MKNKKSIKKVQVNKKVVKLPRKDKKLIKLGKKERKIEKVMREFKEGELRSGSEQGPVVTNPKQAIAISLSEARKKSRKKRK